MMLVEVLKKELLNYNFKPIDSQELLDADQILPICKKVWKDFDPVEQHKNVNDRYEAQIWK